MLFRSDVTQAEAARLLGHPVPVLADALDAFPDLLWNVEIKTPEALAETMRVLRPRLSRMRLLVTSFRHDVAARCAALLDVDCGLLLASRPLDLARMIGDCAGIPRLRTIVWDFNVMDEVQVREARAAGWASHVYGPQTADEHAHCRHIGLDGVITDHPGLLGR